MRTGDLLTLHLDDAPTIIAPDGSTVVPLLATERGSMARFELEAGKTSKAVRHRTVDEIWMVVAGRGEMWRRVGHDESVVELVPGTCLAIAVGTSFQFRSMGLEPLAVIAVTMPPWPGDDEAELVDGRPGW